MVVLHAVQSDFERVLRYPCQFFYTFFLLLFPLPPTGEAQTIAVALQNPVDAILFLSFPILWLTQLTQST